MTILTHALLTGPIRLWVSRFSRYLATALSITLPPFAMSQSVQYVSHPVGVARLTAGPGQTLVSIPFKPFSPALDKVLRDQLTGGTSDTTGDAILKWDAVKQVYLTAFKAAGTGNSARDGHWFSSAATWTPSPLALNPGEGFWIANRQTTTQTVYVCGTIVAGASSGVTLRPGLNLVSYPFTGKIPLNSTQLALNGAYGDRYAKTSDTLNDPSTSETLWLQRQGKTRNLTWRNASGTLATKELIAARGYWFQHKTSTIFTWTEPRPYAYPFVTSSSAPQIVGIRATNGAATLTLDTSTCPNGTIEIYYKDFGAANTFAGDSGWKIAEQGLLPHGQTSLTWTDTGAVARVPISQVFTRVYLAARGDVDNDGDGLPNSRETFVLGTDPLAFNGGTPPPASAKVKALRVGMGDYYGGAYTGLGTDSVVALIIQTASAWGCNTIYAHAFTSTYGTYWANPRTAYLTAEGGHGKNDIFRKLIAAAQPRGIKVIAYVELNRMKPAWDANPAWRVKAADGSDFKPTQYPLSIYSTNVVAWTKSVVTELLDLGVDGVDMAECDLLAWATEATYDTAANNRFFAAYPTGTLGAANWRDMRKQVLTDWHADIGRLVHSRGKAFHVTYTWNAGSDGRLWAESYLADQTGFSFDRLLNLPADARPDSIVAELIWQAQAARYGASTFSSEWTGAAASQFMTFVAGRAKAVTHAEAGTFIGTYAVTPTPADIETSLTLGLAHSDGADLYDHDTVYQTPYTVNGITSNWGAVAVSNAFTATY